MNTNFTYRSVITIGCSLFLFAEVGYGIDCNGNGIDDAQDLNGGALSFQQTPYAVGDYPTSVVASELSGDTAVDLAVGYQGSGFAEDGFVQALRNTGSGNFTSFSMFDTGNDSTMVRSADFNLDGKMDLTMTDQDLGRVSIFKNNYSGSFQFLDGKPTQKCPAIIETGDINVDGAPDIAVSNISGPSVSVYYNTGNGTLAAPLNIPGGSPKGIALADLDNDIDLDLAVTTGSPHILVFKNNLSNNPAFTDYVSYPVSGGGTYLVSAGDFDLDGDKDLAVLSAFPTRLSILLNDGYGTFVADSPAHTGLSNLNIPLSLANKDINGDGFPDILLTTAQQGIFFVKNKRKSTQGFWQHFDTNVPMLASGDSMDIALGDFNNDGRSDIAIPRWDMSDVLVLRNQTTFPVSKDLNGGGVPDECEINHPPFIHTDTPQHTTSFTLTTGNPFSLRFIAGDPDGNPVSISISQATLSDGLPVGSTFDPNTLLFYWTPTSQDVGRRSFTLLASDGTSTASVTVNLRVVRSVRTGGGGGGGTAQDSAGMDPADWVK